MYYRPGIAHIYLIESLTIALCACMHAKSLQSCPTLQSPELQPARLLSTGFSRQGYWNGVPCPPPGHFPDSGFEPESLMLPALAGRFFTTRVTWEALQSALQGRSLFLWPNWKNNWGPQSLSFGWYSSQLGVSDCGVHILPTGRRGSTLWFGPSAAHTSHAVLFFHGYRRTALPRPPVWLSVLNGFTVERNVPYAGLA